MPLDRLPAAQQVQYMPDRRHLIGDDGLAELPFQAIDHR